LPARAIASLEVSMPRTAALAAILLASLASLAPAQSWPDGKELAGRLKDLARLDRATLHEIGRSAGDQKLRLLEIAPEDEDATGPAILVLANAEGDLPLTSLAATELAAEILAAPAGSPAGTARWYLLPVASPDGLDRAFARPRAAGGFNATPVDEDRDGLEAEDPPDDLDGDGLITWMLVEDPAGTWILDEEGLPLRADPARDQPGRYRREREGRDDDGDGRFNEDPAGGVNIARNFPHAFAPWTERGGRWAADQPETRAILEWSFAHPEIAMVVVLGRENWLRETPEAAAEPDGTKPVRVPWRLARELDLEAGAEYPLQTVLQAAAARGARANLTEARVRALLHLEPLAAPPAGDLGWWTALGDAYADFLTAHGLDEPRLAPPLPGPGSPAAWAYFQFGVPAVAVDLWTLPDPADTTAAAATDSLAAQDLRPGPRPDHEHELLKARTESSEHEGWRPFAPVTLPDGTRALVGGPVPGALRTPAAYAAEIRARSLLPFFLELPGWLPRLELAPLRTEERGGGVLAVTAVLRNVGRLPYPTEMGTVNRRPGPITVELNGAEALQHPLRRVVPQLPAGGAVTLQWLVRAGDPDRLELTAGAPALGSVTVKGGRR
jgi:hypothetical protein